MSSAAYFDLQFKSRNNNCKASCTLLTQEELVTVTAQVEITGKKPVLFRLRIPPGPVVQLEWISCPLEHVQMGKDLEKKLLWVLDQFRKGGNPSSAHTITIRNN